MFIKLRAFFNTIEERLFKKEWIGSPSYEATRFTVIYIFIGLIWIIWSDDLLVLLFQDIDLILRFQTIKGWFYVLVSGVLFYFILIKRLGLIKNLNDNILYQNNHDSLTQLPNRLKINEIVDSRIRQFPQTVFALVSLDINDFSNVNELLGYQVGDELIVSLAHNLNKKISSEDLLSRDGDGFILILDLSNRSLDDLNQLLSKILEIVNDEHIIDNQTLFISCCIGVSLYPKDGSTFNELFKASDTAMRHLKGSHANRFNFYTENYHIERVNRVKMINELRKSLDNSELYLLYQPIYNMIDQTIHSFEALVRWKSPSFGLVPPNIFIEHAENSNLISFIDEFVFTECLKLRKKWHDLGDHSTILSINLSSKGLVNPEFMKIIQRLCLEYFYMPNGIQIEITETALISNFELAKTHLMRLKRLGFIIALDDFGAGYSSLTYLHQLPIDCMKIDQSFSINTGTSESLDLILQSIVSLAHQLDLKVVVEGIESEVQKKFFLNIGCVLGQGFLFARPETEEEASHRIIEKKKAKL